MKKLLLALTLLYAPFLFGQKFDHKSVYFDSDVHSLREIEKKAITQFIEGIDRIQSIQLEGHADASGYKDKNESLSQNRVLSVRKHLLALGIPDSLITNQHFGDNKPKDSNESTDGRQENRRVDIRVEYDVPPPMFIEEPTPATARDCSDTTIVFPQGTAVVINRCIYDSIKDQFKLTEFNTGESLRNSNLTTMTTDGQPLMSGGMFKLEIPDSTPVIVLIKRQEICGEFPDLKLWKEQHNEWESMVEKLEVVEIDDQEYFKVTMDRSAVINCDMLYEAAKGNGNLLRNPFARSKVKVVLRNGLKIDSAKISWDNPPTVLIGKKKHIRKNVAIFNAGCPCSSPLISVYAKDKNGNLYSMDYTNSELLTKRELFGRCKMQTISKKFLFFKIRDKSLYRKYIIKKKDLKK